jgi:hypothetical protein
MLKAKGELTIEDLRGAVELAKISSPVVIEEPDMSPQTADMFAREAAEQGLDLYIYSRGIRIWAPAQVRKVV